MCQQLLLNADLAHMSRTEERASLRIYLLSEYGCHFHDEQMVGVYRSKDIKSRSPGPGDLERLHVRIRQLMIKLIATERLQEAFIKSQGYYGLWQLAIVP